MDLLYGVVSLDRDGLEPARTERAGEGECLSSDRRCLLGQTRTLCNADQAAHVESSPDLLAGMLGEITNLPALCARYGVRPATDLPLLARSCRVRGFKAVRELAGLYTAALYDGVRRELRLFQDPFSSQWALYWAVRGRALFFATSLKKLLALCGQDRRVDDEAVAHFMVNGFVPNERTLLSNVRKLVPGSYLVADPGGVRLRALPRGACRVGPTPRDIESCAREYYAVVRRGLAALTGPCRSQALNLIGTAGFDSNFYLHVATREYAKPINTYCIGTTDTGRHAGETDRAARIAAAYEKVSFHRDDLAESALFGLPNIVWRLEGACYERGIFLRDRLAAMVSAHANWVIGGDLANQVLNPRFHRRWRFPRKKVGYPVFWNAHWRKDVFFNLWRDRPRALGLYMNIKQNGLLLSSYSVHLKYMYLLPEFVALVRAARRRWPDMDATHKHVVNRHLSPPVRAQVNLPRVHGIDETFYFRQRPLRERVAASLLRSEFLLDAAGRTLLGKLLDVFVEQNDPWFTRITTRILYLDVWHRLFVEGPPDNVRNGPGLDRSLEEFLRA